MTKREYYNEFHREYYNEFHREYSVGRAQYRKQTRNLIGLTFLSAVAGYVTANVMLYLMGFGIFVPVAN